MQIEYMQDGAEITSEEWITCLNMKKFSSFGFEYKNWTNENLILYWTDPATREIHYYSNFVGIIWRADKVLLSLPKSVKADPDEDNTKKRQTLQVYAKLLDLYFAEVRETAKQWKKEKKAAYPWCLDSQSVEQWCLQAETFLTHIGEPQIIAAVNFEKVYEWMLGWLYRNQIQLWGSKVFFHSDILKGATVDINDRQNNIYQWKVYRKQQNGSFQERENVFENQEKKNIPDIVIEINQEDPKLQNACCILDAKYTGWNHDSYILPGNADIYKQFFYQEQFIKLYQEMAPEKEVQIYNSLILPDYMGDTVQKKEGVVVRENILRFGAILKFDFHPDHNLGIWQVNVDRLIRARVSEDKEVHEQIRRECREITEHILRTNKNFVPMKTEGPESELGFR